ncbi:MAG: transporter [Gemmatimonadales bacterium]|nr:MAG: transporter [Gemmatimonadales bacterium]
MKHLVFISTVLGQAAILCSTPGVLAAQAVCSAPHSSPTLAGRGSVRVLPRWAGWIQVSGLEQSANRFFTPSGDRRAFLSEATFRTRSAFLTGALGLGHGVELWAQLPIHRLSVERPETTTRSNGLGDLRLAARVGARALGLNLPFALRIGTKLPGSDFPVDASVLPLTEGQRDWELSLESGSTLRGEAVHAIGWAGYRWREANVKADRDPGDEWFAHLAVGGRAGPMMWQVGAEALWGRPLTVLGFELRDEARRLVQLVPTVGMALGPGDLELTAQLPLSGRNLPAANGLSVGYRITWGLEPQVDESALDDWLERR